MFLSSPFIVIYYICPLCFSQLFSDQFCFSQIETFQAKKKAAALREKDQVYDEIGGEVSSRSEDYYSDTYQFNEGQFSYRPYLNGKPTYVNTSCFISQAYLWHLS